VLTRLRADSSGQAVATGVSSAILGYASSIALVINGLSRAGASRAEVSSGLLALGAMMALLTVGLSLRLRIPVSVVWSTPGMVLVAGVGRVDGGWPAAVGAFMVCGGLLILTGLVAPLNRLMLRLPTVLTSAVLAGVLLPFCLEPARAVSRFPLQAGLIVLAWAVTLRFKPSWASSVALAGLVVVALTHGSLTLPSGSGLAPHLHPVRPGLSWAAVIQIAVPLYIVTMAAQNLVGVAVMTTFGYRPPVGPLLVSTGAGTLVNAPFAGPPVNLAAITGALTSGPTAHEDPGRRYVAAVASGLTYLVLAGLAPVTASIVTQTDPALVDTAAGLALVLTLAAAAAQALGPEPTRIPAAVTLVVTASGMTAFGVGAAPWGLLAGGVLMLAGVGRPAPAVPGTGVSAPEPERE
jgi:benzoate membrane transport protein